MRPLSGLNQLYGSALRSGSGSLLNNSFNEDSAESRNGWSVADPASKGKANIEWCAPHKVEPLMIRNNYDRSESEDFVSAPVRSNVSDSGSRSQ
jgi:hypothetical protein